MWIDVVPRLNIVAEVFSVQPSSHARHNAINYVIEDASVTNSEFDETGSGRDLSLDYGKRSDDMTTMPRKESKCQVWD